MGLKKYTYTEGQNLLTGHVSYINGWANGGNFYDDDASILGNLCFGVTSGGVKRALILRFKTPPQEYFIGKDNLSSIEVNVALYRDQTGTDDWYSNISTTPPNPKIIGHAQIPSSMPTTWPAKINNITFGPRYKVQEFNTGSYAFQPNTTYYMWLYTTTPVGEKIRGWYGSNKGNAPKITVRIGTKQAVSDSLYKRPEKVELYGHTGYYDPMNAMIPIDKSYPYIYARSDSKASNKWYQKKEVSEITIDGTTYSIFDIYSPDESTSDYRKIQVVRCKQNLTNDKVNPDQSFYYEYEPPKYAFEAYCHTDVPRVVTPDWEIDGKTRTGKATFNTITYNNLDLIGATTNINKYDNPEYTSSDLAYILAQNKSFVSIDSSSEFGPKMNGKTVYGIFQNNLLINYYCGSPVENITNSKINFYGIDGVKPISGIPEERSQSITVNSNENIWEFKGWSIIENSYNSFAPFEQLVKENDNFNSKNKMTLYGVYSQGWTIKYKIVIGIENGEIKYSEANYTSTTNYIYGKGQQTTNIPPEPLDPNNTEDSLIIGWIRENEPLSARRSWTTICQEEERPYSVIGIAEDNVIDLVPRTRIIDEGTWKKVYKVYHDEEWEMPVLTPQTFDYKISTKNDKISIKNDEISQ